MPEYLISETFHSVVTSLAFLSLGLAEVVVGVLMVMRKPRELKLFGAALLILVGSPAVRIIGEILNADFAPFNAINNAVIGAFLLLGTLLIYRVAVYDFVGIQRRVAHIVFAVYMLLTVIIAVAVLTDLSSLASEISRGVASEVDQESFGRFNPILILFVGLGACVIGYLAIHTVVEHSRGQIYRSLMLGSFGLIVCLGIGVRFVIVGHTQEIEELLFIIASGVAAIVFLITALIHEVPEIRRERAEASAAG